MIRCYDVACRLGCFQYDLAYADFKDLLRGIFSDKLLHLKLLAIHNMMDIKEYVTLRFTNFFIQNRNEVEQKVNLLRMLM